MQTTYRGTLAPHSPLAQFLTSEVLGKTLGIHSPNALFDTYALNHQATVLRYTDRHSLTSVVGKFYRPKSFFNGDQLPLEQAMSLLAREYTALETIRALGFEAPPYRVVRPLACNSLLDALLVEEYAPGYDLGSVLHTALCGGDYTLLQARLTDVAGFLAALHQRSQHHAPGDSVADLPALGYLTKIVQQLAAQGVLDPEHQATILDYRDRWQATGLLCAAPQLLIHGDATTANLLFGGDGDVIAIDLERARWDDGAVDLGCVVAELKHWFLRYTDKPWTSEWAIQHLYACYASARGLTEAERQALTRRGQFYMGSFLLRISRNAWLDLPYRRRLAHEGIACLAL